MPAQDRRDVVRHRTGRAASPAPVLPIISSDEGDGSSGLPFLVGAAAPRPLRAASPTEVAGARVAALGIGRHPL